MKYFSMFSGIGGFELGIQQAYEETLQNYRRGNNTDTDPKQYKQEQRPEPLCAGYSEIDKYAVQAYQKHFPNHKNYGDCTKIQATELPDFDMLVGGVPCQAWSIAGKRGGFSDERGNMWWHFIRILQEKQPKMFIAENVKGILSHNEGKSFEILCEAFCDAGYVIDFDILNSKNFGVPQNRERVFIVGKRFDFYLPQEYNGLYGDSKELYEMWREKTANRVQQRAWEVRA